MAGFFYKLCEKIEKAVSICVIIQQDCKVKRKLQLHNVKVLNTTVWRYVTNKGWKALKRNAAMASEEFANFIPKDDQHSHDANSLVTMWIIVDETFIQRSSPQNTGLAIRQRPHFTWKIVNLHTLWELVHSIPHRLENVRNHKGRHSGC